MMTIAQAIAKLVVGSFLALGLFTLGLLVWLWPSTDYLPAKPLPFEIERVLDGPILHVGMSERLTRLADEEGHANINGPSLIRVPEWIEDPLGTYYLNFAHHKGDHIRLAYADRVEAPWTIHEPGSLALVDSLFPTEL
jgi:hypothetical protein